MAKTMLSVFQDRHKASDAAMDDTLALLQFADGETKWPCSWKKWQDHSRSSTLQPVLIERWVLLPCGSMYERDMSQALEDIACRYCQKEYPSKTARTLDNQLAYLPIKHWLQQLVSTFPDCFLITHVPQENAARDPRGGAAYARMWANSPNDVSRATLMLACDTAVSSSMKKVTCLFAFVQELGPVMACKFPLMLAVYVGKHTPKADQFFHPLVQDLKQWESKPVKVSNFLSPMSSEMDCIEMDVNVRVLGIVSDAVARSWSSGGPGHASRHPCLQCFVEGTKGLDGTMRFNPVSEPLLEQRAKESFLAESKVFLGNKKKHQPCAIMQRLAINQAEYDDLHRRFEEKRLQGSKRSKHEYVWKGIRSLSPLTDIQHIHPIEAYPVDMMHAVILGVTASAYKSLGSAGNKLRFTGTSAELDAATANIVMTSNVVRGIEPLSRLNDFKSAHLEHYLHIWPFLRVSYLPSDVKQLLRYLSAGVAYLMNEISAQKLSSSRICFEWYLTFLKKMEPHYWTFNAHSVLHLPRFAELYGPLMPWSAYALEAHMGKAVTKLTSNTHPSVQILKKYSRIMGAGRACMALKGSTKDNQDLVRVMNKLTMPHLLEYVRAVGKGVIIDPDDDMALVLGQADVQKWKWKLYSKCTCMPAGLSLTTMSYTMGKTKDHVVHERTGKLIALTHIWKRISHDDDNDSDIFVVGRPIESLMQYQTFEGVNVPHVLSGKRPPSLGYPTVINLLDVKGVCCYEETAKDVRYFRHFSKHF